MQKDKLPSLRIGALEINPPIIQGAMGMRASRGGLSGAVAREGCAGLIPTVGLGKFEDYAGGQYVKVCADALRQELRSAKSLSNGNGAVGVNIMVATTDYKNAVAISVEEDADLIVSGAGLAVDLPGLVDGKPVPLLPIVSSARALKIICKKWQKNYNRLPDGVVVEGVRAGGHLGFRHEEVVEGTAARLDDILADVLELVNSLDQPFPVIAAGGIFDGKDIVRVLKMGCAGVQMATRFVCTDECDVHENFKQTYLDAKKEDITIIRSPVGLPGRVVNSEFVEKIKRGETLDFKCAYRCLKTCDPQTAPYCIARVLSNAAEGKMDEAFAFCGDNVYRCNEVVPVKQLIEQLTEEALVCLNADAE